MDLIPLLNYNMKCDKFLQAVKGNHHDLKYSLADLQCLARCDVCFFSTGGGVRRIGQTNASPAIAKILLTSKLQIFQQSSGSFSAVWLLRLIGSVEDLHELFFSAFRPDGHGSDGAIYWVLVGLRRQWQVGECILGRHDLPVCPLMVAHSLDEFWPLSCCAKGIRSNWSKTCSISGQVCRIEQHHKGRALPQRSCDCKPFAAFVHWQHSRICYEGQP